MRNELSPGTARLGVEHNQDKQFAEQVRNELSPGTARLGVERNQDKQFAEQVRNALSAATRRSEMTLDYLLLAIEVIFV